MKIYFIFISFRAFFHCFLSFKFLLLTFQEIIAEKINFTQSSPVGNPLKKTLKNMFVKEKDVKDFWNFSKSEKIFLRKDFDIKKITLRCPNISERIW